jgi:hypothetical protein
MTAKARVKEADVARVLRAARKVGAKHVRVEPDGSIDIVLEEYTKTDVSSDAQPPPPPEEVKTIW